MKEFYYIWTDKEIDEYIEQYSVLILFTVHAVSKEAQITVYGDMIDLQRRELIIIITSNFGGSVLNSALSKKINEFAGKWYNKNVLKKKTRVINCKRVSK